jgi:hypothetical protein
MTYVTVDYKGRACRVDEELLDDYKAGVMEDGGALLKFDGNKVYEFTGREEGEQWDELS